MELTIQVISVIVIAILKNDSTFAIELFIFHEAIIPCTTVKDEDAPAIPCLFSLSIQETLSNKRGAILVLNMLNGSNIVIWNLYNTPVERRKSS